MSDVSASGEEKTRGGDFIRQIIRDDLESGRVQQVVTRFPPEPNGYLHIGHAKAFTLSFSVAEEFGGICRLRYDDTNPEKEDREFVHAIEEDIHWMGFQWEGEPLHASSYFDRFYEWAVELVKAGKAYVDHQSPAEIAENRGTPTRAGIDSPFRNRTPDENLALLEQMKAGEMAEGECVLRAKIAMDHVNILMRDPTMYRIRKETHHQTGDEWCIYPMYDFAHGYEDAIEGVTHSLCSLEFENHRPLYDWFLDNVSVPSRPHQYEFARLNLTHTIMSKRYLRKLVEEHHVHGWDDPRMPTLRGMRRRGYPAAAIRKFIDEIGVSKVNSLVDVEFLNFHVREALNKDADRRMAVLNPLKLTVTNWPEGKIETFIAENNPGDPAAGERPLEFSGELWVERDDYLDDAPGKWFRMAPGKEVRLKYAYYVTVEDVIRNEEGEPLEILCTYDPESRGGSTPDGRKVRGTLHWLSRHDALDAEVRLYDHLITLEDVAKVEEGKEFLDYVNPDSERIITAKVEPSVGDSPTESRFQFLRNGYFVADRVDHRPGTKPVFNRIVGLRDSWAKIAKKG
ncbi:MAG: glutamine--tRNA ligase/YqeY domain fusion protein [Spirochaetaceae bacterium]|nr:glutamine--tRNA ligase/YqeY domain fusion protein [Spirochaetaceae bacterium]MDT8298259.1 glutamine--tRNA ligase/YqeY domain fusion protein [Spirochaetaceae bacterium]